MRPGSLGWIVAHEARLAYRDWKAMMTAGRPGRARAILIGAVIFIVLMHGFAYEVVRPYANVWRDPSKETLVVVTGTAFFSLALLLSQALEGVTRAFYGRSDLDLILSSPLPPTRLFAVRLVAISVTTSSMAMVLAAAFIDMLAFTGGARWLSAYPVVLAMGAGATALAVVIAIALFRVLGPKRTRIAAQILAAVIGAAFVIGAQVVAILSYGTMSRLAFFQSEAIISGAPATDSPLWWPAKAMMGDPLALLAVVAIAAVLLGAAILGFAPRFAGLATAAAGTALRAGRRRPAMTGFRAATPMQTLRRKEWALLRRDPWLVSQTLMQVLYLLPPAVLLWKNFGSDINGLVVLAPVLVMAAGQLAGGLAWLSVSGEDAPDLVASAPITAADVTRAKIQSVAIVIAVVFAPLLAALTIASPRIGVTTAVGLAAATAAATLIQLWFRVAAKRSQFKRRQTSSRMATFAEAFSSIGWASAAGFAAAGSIMAVFIAALSLGVLGLARAISPSSGERAAARRQAANPPLAGPAVIG